MKKFLLFGGYIKVFPNDPEGEPGTFLKLASNSFQSSIEQTSSIGKTPASTSCHASMQMMSHEV